MIGLSALAGSCAREANITEAPRVAAAFEATQKKIEKDKAKLEAEQKKKPAKLEKAGQSKETGDLLSQKAMAFKADYEKVKDSLGKINLKSVQKASSETEADAYINECHEIEAEIARLEAELKDITKLSMEVLAQNPARGRRCLLAVKGMQRLLNDLKLWARVFRATAETRLDALKLQERPPGKRWGL